MEGPDGLLELIREEAMKVRLCTLAVSIVSLIFSKALGCIESFGSNKTIV
jgi:hypothetical protein